jgi:hypothetical protein
MTTDYRLKLLRFLKDAYPNKTNISPLLHEYLTETNSPRPYYADILHTLKKDGFVIFGNEATDSITTARAQVYNDSHIIVGLTYPGLDEIIRLEKQEYDLKNAERVYKTYRWTRFLAIAGFIISLMLGLLKLAEVLK